MRYNTKAVKAQICEDWSLGNYVLDGCKIIYSSYENHDYDGHAFVLLERPSGLFEVNGGHCSCFGLEGQWEEEETSKEALMHRLKHGCIYGADTEILLKKVKRLK